jgi:hypothetical protein
MEVKGNMLRSPRIRRGMSVNVRDQAFSLLRVRFKRLFLGGFEIDVVM